LEETYETFDAIQEADQTGETHNLKEELGDVLLQVVFHSTIAAERGDFTIDEVVKGVSEKLILRHPHVFGDKNLETATDVLNNWDELKKAEREASGKIEREKNSLLDDVSLNFPALLEGLKLSKKAAKVGFDWEKTEQIFDKLNEEVGELKKAIEENKKEEISEEIGDLLFVIVNLARRLDVEPETALKKTNRKFRRRFSFIESELKTQGKSFDESDLDEMDALWSKAKKHFC
jgi:tetrapyrrole methylase family protein/MazG family protein/ATP diphosphatase